MRRAYHVRDVLVYFALFIVTLLLLGCGATYGPTVEVTETKTTNYDSTGAVSSIVVQIDIKGKQTGVAMMDANDTQEQISKDWAAVEQKKIEVLKGSTCTPPTAPASFSGATAEAEYWRMVDNVMDNCAQEKTLLAVAFLTSELGDNLQETSGAGSAQTQISKSASATGIAAEQASAKKWGNITTIGVAGFTAWGLGNIFNSMANLGAQAGTTLVANNGSRLNYSNAGNPSQYKDGIDLSLIGDKSTGSDPSGGVPTAGASTTTNSASGDNVESPITITDSPFIWGDKFNYENLQPQSLQLNENSTLSIPNNSNDNNSFGTGGITGTLDNNASSPNR